MFLRLILTMIVLVVAGYVIATADAISAIGLGNAATLQLQNSNTAYVQTVLGLRGFGSLHFLASVLCAFVLCAIWFRPVARWVGIVCAVAFLGIAGFKSHSAYAYYDKTNYTETVEVMPNQSLFIIPEVGDNKDSQAQFMSQQYIAEKKIPAKRIEIPHQKLGGTGYFTDFWVPAARAYIVDRTPYHREWSDNATRGTSARGEGFHFETADSLDVGTSISIAAYVTEEDAAKFLYWFGVQPIAGDPNDPQVQYASKLYSYSLAQVMDGIVRGKVQAALATEFGKLPLDDAMQHKADIISKVEASVKAEFAPKGITIQYIGYAGGLEYDNAVQATINDLYISHQRARMASLQKDSIPTLTSLAMISAIDSFGAGLQQHGLPNLPSVLVLPPDLSGAVTKLVGGK